MGDILNRPFSTYAPVSGVKSPYATFNTNANYYQALRPFPQYDFIATDCCLQNVGHSSYEAMIATLERRFSQGLNLQASYTWAKSITNADSALPGTNAGVNQEQDPANPKSIKALSIQDIPHTFVVSYIYELPFGKGKAFGNFSSPFLRSAVSGFKIGAVQRYQSGQPTSFGCADGIPGFQNCIAFSRVPGSSLKSPAFNHIDPFRQLRANYPNVGSDPNVDSEFNGLTNTGNAAYSQFQKAPAIYSQNNSINRSARAVQSGNCATCDNGAFQFGNIPRVHSRASQLQVPQRGFQLPERNALWRRILLHSEDRASQRLQPPRLRNTGYPALRLHLRCPDLHHQRTTPDADHGPYPVLALPCIQLSNHVVPSVEAQIDSASTDFFAP